MTQEKLDSITFGSEQEKANVLTLSEIFKELEPTKIISKLRESGGDILLAAEKILEDSTIPSESDTSRSQEEVCDEFIL
jgi:hypothetical protein